MKFNYLTSLFLLLSVTALGQYAFEPSNEHPYGLPNPEAPEELLDFAPLIGECNCKSQTRNPDQTWAEPIDMVWRFKYIMNGMGIQDETLKTDGRYSGSIRQFIPDSTRWFVHYYSSGGPSPSLPTWEGNKNEDGKIVLYREQQAPNGMDGFYRLTFYDIDKKGFKWAGEWVNKTETIIFPTWKIDCSNGKIERENDEQAIIEAANNFSKALMAKDVDAVVNSYSSDAKIFPNRLEILGGDALRKYWTLRDGAPTTIHHKITPTQIQIFGDYAHDYGHFEGKSQKKDGSVVEWKGKYVVVWKKEAGVWKMYLDIWNRISD